MEWVVVGVRTVPGPPKWVKHDFQPIKLARGNRSTFFRVEVGATRPGGRYMGLSGLGYLDVGWYSGELFVVQVSALLRASEC